MLTRSAEALRRLGGPVCPVCDTVGADGIEVRYLNSDDSKWLRSKGRRSVQKESLAPMCLRCFHEMTNAMVSRRAAEAAAIARREASALADELHLNSLNGPRYRAACAEHEDDLTAAERMSAGWGVGNGLFGSRGE